MSAQIRLGGLRAVVASFGERLKQEREKRGMTLEDVSGVTKISVRNLRALEQEKFEVMPGGIFNRGFVRAYAKHLGLDDDQVVADYMEAVGESIPTLDPPNPPAQPNGPEASVAADEHPEESSPQVPWAALLGLIVLGTVVLTFWSYHRKTPEIGPVTVESGSGDHPAEAPSPEHDAAAAAVPRAQTGATNDPSNALSSQGRPATNLPAAGAQNPAAGAARAGFDLALRAHDEVWLSSAVDGKPPSEAIMEDGQSIALHASDRAILRVGNAAALEIAFNGQRVPVGGAEGEVRTFTFTSSGLQAPPPLTPSPN